LNRQEQEGVERENLLSLLQSTQKDRTEAGKTVVITQRQSIITDPEANQMWLLGFEEV
jgi:hypothetical protein